MNKMTITGEAAEVRWSYYVAAALSSWSITDNKLTATVASVDAYRAAQAPLTFVVTRPSGTEWKWPLTDLQIAGQTLTALVPQE